MITYLSHEKVDKMQWDRCVNQATNGLVYAWSWYLDIAHPGWEALVEIKDGNYFSIMPLTCKRKYFINYLCQPFFVQQLGVFSVGTVTSETTQTFLRAIPSKYRLVEIRLNEQNPMGSPCRGIALHRNHLLDLSKNYETLYFNYHDNTKRNLKKSFNYHLQLVEEVPIHTVIDLFRCDRGAMVKHWGDREYARLEQLTTAAISSGNAFVVGVKSIDNDDIICGALFMLSHHRLTFLFSGNSKAGKEAHAMTFLLDQIIKKYSGHLLTFDFEGSDDDDLARFYHGFGGVPVTYPSFTFRGKNPLK